MSGEKPNPWGVKLRSTGLEARIEQDQNERNLLDSRQKELRRIREDNAIKAINAEERREIEAQQAASNSNVLPEKPLGSLGVGLMKVKAEK